MIVTTRQGKRWFPPPHTRGSGWRAWHTPQGNQLRLYRDGFATWWKSRDRTIRCSIAEAEYILERC